MAGLHGTCLRRALHPTRDKSAEVAMQLSWWFSIKPRALQLQQEKISLPHTATGVAKSTLSCFRDKCAYFDRRMEEDMKPRGPQFS